jgi:hypothetical protein
MSAMLVTDSKENGSPKNLEDSKISDTIEAEEQVVSSTTKEEAVPVKEETEQAAVQAEFVEPVVQHKPTFAEREMPTYDTGHEKIPEDNYKEPAYKKVQEKVQMSTKVEPVLSKEEDIPELDTEPKSRKKKAYKAEKPHASQVLKENGDNVKTWSTDALSLLAADELEKRHGKDYMKGRKRARHLTFLLAVVIVAGCGAGYFFWQENTEKLTNSEEEAAKIKEQMQSLEDQLYALENSEESLKADLDDYMTSKSYNKVLQIADRIHSEYPDSETDTYAQEQADKAREALEKLGIETGDSDDQLDVDYDDYTALNYDKLLSNSKNYRGTKAKFYGKIVQLEDGADSGISVVRLAVDGNTDNIIVVQFEKSDSINVEEGDYINTGGIIVTDLTYTTVLGSKVTVPAMSATYVTKVGG